MNKKSIFYIFISILLSSTVFFAGYTKVSTPKELYRVYLKGNTIGYIKSKIELENYINDIEDSIKNTYKVDKVYAPNDLKIIKEITYNKKVSGIHSIYLKIKKISPFTIKGNIVTIKGTEEYTEDSKYIGNDIKINVLNKKVFTDALEKSLKVFIDEESYKNYINHTQKEIKDTGKSIESLYVKNEISIKEGKIPVDEQIFMDADALSKYLLFGSTSDRTTYVVKSGDTIEQIAFDNKLSVSEFLIANINFTGADDLLYAGQKVDVGTVKPLFKLIEEDHIVEYEESHYKTEIVYDDSIMMGVERVKQEGVDGKNKVTKKLQKSNGDIVSAVVVSSEEIKSSVNKVILRGNGSINVSASGTWAWPTQSPYTITSNYGWRWGKLHEGIDIIATGFGSPIYAANDGVVSEASYNSINGNYIVINHNNGYYTIYAHMSALLSKVGDIVTIGQQIGKMGMTGFATGTHLHFGVYKGGVPGAGSSFNPLVLYR